MKNIREALQAYKRKSIIKKGKIKSDYQERDIIVNKLVKIPYIEEDYLWHYNNNLHLEKIKLHEMLSWDIYSFVVLDRCNNPRYKIYVDIDGIIHFSEYDPLKTINRRGVPVSPDIVLTTILREAARRLVFLIGNFG